MEMLQRQANLFNCDCDPCRNYQILTGKCAKYNSLTMQVILVNNAQQKGHVNNMAFRLDMALKLNQTHH